MANLANLLADIEEGPFSYTDEKGDGVKTSFVFSFFGPDEGYLREEDIRPFVRDSSSLSLTYNAYSEINYSDNPWTISGNTITFENPIENSLDGGLNLRIRRIMPKGSAYLETNTNAIFQKDNINNSFLQQLYSMHEVLDGFTSVSGDIDSAASRLESLVALYEKQIAAAGYEVIGTWEAGVTTFEDYGQVAYYKGQPFKLRPGEDLDYVAQGDDPTVSPDSEHVVPWIDQQTYIMKSATDLVNGVCVNGRTISATEIDAFGIVIADTMSYHESFPTLVAKGGGRYFLTTLDNVRSALSDNTWVPDDVVNFYLFGGTEYVAFLNIYDGSATPEQAGALGVKTGDDTKAFQAIGDALPAGSVINCNGGSHYVIKYDETTGQLCHWTKPLKIRGNGAKLSYKTWSSVTSDSSPVFYFEGSLDEKVLINPCNTEERVVTPIDSADLSKFSVGDWVYLKSNDGREPWNYPDGKGLFYEIGELRVIRSIYEGTGEIVFDRTFDNEYDYEAGIQKINFLYNPEVTGFDAIEIDKEEKVSGEAVDRNAGHLISYYACMKPTTKTISTLDNRLSLVWHDHCIGALAERCDSQTDKTIYASEGGHSYCVRYTMSRYCRTIHCWSRKLRHTIDYSSAHDCFQYFCHTIEPAAGGFSLHGTHDARIHSYSDSYTGQGRNGWQIGNPDFGPSHDVTIDNFISNGQMTPIWILSGSYNVWINNFHHKAVLDASNAVRIAGGAHDIFIDGVNLDMSASRSVNYAVFSYPSMDSSYAVQGSFHISCSTPGATPLVTFTSTAEHNLEVGQELYVNARYTGYEGKYTVTSVTSTTEFEAQYELNTTTSINRDIGSQVVWKYGNWKPCSNIHIKNANIDAKRPIYIGGDGTLEIDGLEAKGTDPTSAVVRIDSNYGTGNVDQLVMRRITCTSQVNSALSLGNESPARTIIEDNYIPNYTKAYIDMGGSATQKQERLIGENIVRIKNNKGKPNSATVGFIGFNIWDALRDNSNFEFEGNEYPLNASISDVGYNKNWEYGYFAPVIFGSSSAGSVTYHNQQGTYKMTKRELSFKMRLTWSSFTGSGQMRIRMPYNNSGIATPVQAGEASLTYTGDLMPVWNADYIAMKSNSGSQTASDIPINVPIQSGDILLAGSIWLDKDASAPEDNTTPEPDGEVITIDDFEDITDWSAGAGELTQVTDTALEGQAMRIRGKGTSSTIINSKTLDTSITPADGDVFAMSVRNNLPYVTTNTALQLGDGTSWDSVDFDANVVSNGKNSSLDKNEWSAWHVSETGADTLANITNMRLRSYNTNSPFIHDVTVDSIIANAKGVPTFVFTFDDGYETSYTAALDIFKKYGFLGTIFLPVDKVASGGEYMVWSQVKALNDEGWPICLDGTRDDRSMTDNATVADAVAELVGMKDDLTAQGLDPDMGDYFCYPFGYHFDTTLANDAVIVDSVTSTGTDTVTFGNTSTITDGMTVYGYNVPDGTTVIAGGGTDVSSVQLSTAIPAGTFPMQFVDLTPEFSVDKLPRALKAAGIKMGRITGGGAVYTRQGFGEYGALTIRGQGWSGATANQAYAMIDEVMLRGTTLVSYIHKVNEAPTEWTEDTANVSIHVYDKFLDAMLSRINEHVQAGNAVVLTFPQLYERDNI